MPVIFRKVTLKRENYSSCYLKEICYQKKMSFLLKIRQSWILNFSPQTPFRGWE